MDAPKQKILGSSGLVILIALLSAFVPLSTDLYLPALPGMSAFFQAPADRINLTLTAFFIFYAAGTLIWGPMSDHYGRKPVLLVGLAIYVIGSALCACAWSITALIVFRILQAAGGSAAGAVATAIVKDVYSGKRRESVLAVVQSMVLISPALGPVLGAYLLMIMSWRGVFWTLAGIGVVALIGSALLVETITLRSQGMLLQTIGRLGKVLQNRGFAMLLALFSIGGISGMAYIASSTYIYQNYFHQSEQAYSYYFAFNALGMIAGPMLFLWASRRMHSETIIRTGFAVTALAGLLVFFFGSARPWLFALCILPSSIAGPFMRPPASNLMLEQQKGDTGSVSSVMGCTGLLMGSLGMQLISLNWGSTIHALGVMTFATASLSLVAWPLVLPHIRRMPGPKAGIVERSEPIS